MKQKQTKTIIVLGIIAFVLALASVSFAFWQLTFRQENENIVNSTCLNVGFTGSNDISLLKTTPIDEEKGKEQEPYTFTITNECDGGAHYVINLETITSEEKKLKEEYLRGYLTNDKEEVLFNDTLKDEYINNEKVIKTSSKAIKLYEGDLGAKGSHATFNLRLWLDESVENEDSMSATYEGKITVTSTYRKIKPAIDTLKELAKTRENELAYDGIETLGEEYGTDDNNLRFYGNNPKNYIDFNNEYEWHGYYSIDSDELFKVYSSLEECNEATSYNYNCTKFPSWRIIGVMNNVEDENGNVGSHLKIIRSSIGDYSWDSSESNINNGMGVNEWSTSDIAKVLNDNYYYKQSGGICYMGGDNKEKTCPNWEQIGLDDNSRAMVSKIKWNTGTTEKDKAGSATQSEMYKAERSENTGKNCPNSLSCNDDIGRTTIWPGYIGLMYPSDFGYASPLNCWKSTMGQWNISGCPSDTWLFLSYFESENNAQWTMIPTYYELSKNANQRYASYVYNIKRGQTNAATFSHAPAIDAYAIRPVVYLNSNVEFEEDDDENYGSIDNPFRIKV